MSHRYDPKLFRGSKVRFSRAQPRRSWLRRLVSGRSGVSVGVWLVCLVTIWAVFYGAEQVDKPVPQVKAAIDLMTSWWEAAL